MIEEALININYPFDLDYLLNLYLSLKDNALIYNDERYGIINNWNIIKIEHDDYIENLKKNLGIDNARARFYILKSYAYLPEHVDNNTKCSINVILSEKNIAPVTINGKNYFYTQCLLNTQSRHGVKNGSEERLLFKLSIFDLEFYEVKKKICKYIIN